MLHKIAIKNFFSIADRQEISFKVPANAPNLPCFRASWSNAEHVLPVVVGFYGANASGKSTALRAIVTTAFFVQNSFSNHPNNAIPFFNPYAHNDWWNHPTEILIEFDSRLTQDAQSAIFRYELHIANDPIKFGKSVVYECLSYSPNKKFRKLFERHEQKFSFGHDFGVNDNDPRIPGIRPNASVISTLAQFNHAISNHFILSLSSLQTNISGLDRTQLDVNRILTFYVQNPAYLTNLNKELRRLDLGLEEMKILPGNTGGYTAMFKHVGLDCDITFAQESMGTRKFIEIFPRLHFALQTGSVAIVDELDTDIHPLLLPELLGWFYNMSRNPLAAQLLFTAHNPAVLNDLEKEQVFFTKKPHGKPTQIYRAKDIKGLRREPSLMKKYLSGELDAIPHIG